MIVVTGPGRSGTSVVADLYGELGFDPGGEWYGDLRAGREAHDVVVLNEAIMRDLGIGIPTRNLRWGGKPLEEALPAPLADRLRGSLQGIPEFLGGSGLVRWDRFDVAVRRRGQAIRDLAAGRALAKDPRFCWTLGVWAAAGASIDHVVLCLRAVDAIVESRIRLGHLVPHSRGRAKNALLYAVGLCLMGIHEHGLSHGVVWFPEFLRDPGRLYEALRFPEPVSRERFDDAFGRVVKPELIEEPSGADRPGV